MKTLVLHNDICKVFINLQYTSNLVMEFSAINECASIPCMHSGTCTDTVNGYTCECTDGYTGVICETGRQCTLLSSTGLFNLFIFV